jgi:OmcA/MtrC family decaheme c-type cytochrome
MEQRMKGSTTWWWAAALVLATLAGCGDSGGGDAVSLPVPPTPSQVGPAIAAAAQVPSNDTAINQTAPFTVLQGAGLPAVSIGSPLRVNFTVFSDGAVKTGLTLADVSFAIARLIPGADGNPDEWVNYVSRKATASPGVGPGGSTSPLASAMQAANDPKTVDSQLAYNSAGYYTYTFTADITDPNWNAVIDGVEYSTNGVAFIAGATHRVAIQLRYKDAQGKEVRVNPYFDFTFAASGSGYNSAVLTDPVRQDSRISDVSSCNTCHEKLALHGGGMVATQYCVMCHNPGTTDPNSGNVLTFSTMTHNIHAGRLLSSAPGGESYIIWGFRDTEYDYSNVGYPQDLRNCSRCHTASPATPNGDRWKASAPQEACLTCHASNAGSTWNASHVNFAQVLVGPGAAAKDMTNAQCTSCHFPGTSLSAEVVHWPQQQVNQALYRVNIESATFNNTPDGKGRSVTVKYTLTNPTDGDRPYRLLVNAADCTRNSSGAIVDCDNATFGNLKLYLAYQNMVGQPTTVTEYSAYNNGGGVAFACAYEGPTTIGTSTSNACARTATNDGNNRYTVTIPLPDDTPTQVAFGTAMVASAGQIREVKLQSMSSNNPRPPVVPRVLVNTAVQHTSVELALTGSLQPRRTIVSDDKCNVCHAVLGTASGSNTMPNAFHAGARNTTQSCVVCHDANRSSSTVMTSGQTVGAAPMNESYQSKYMLHAIHAGSKRIYPYTEGNLVFGKFDRECQLIGDPTVTCTPGSTNWAAQVLWPGPTVDGQKRISCDACHVDGSYTRDQSPVGAVVGPRTGTDPHAWPVITPRAASCVSCHNSEAAVQHVMSAGNARYGNANQGMSLQIAETCNDCHGPTNFLAVGAVHGGR